MTSSLLYIGGHHGGGGGYGGYKKEEIKTEDAGKAKDKKQDDKKQDEKKQGKNKKAKEAVETKKAEKEDEKEVEKTEEKAQAAAVPVQQPGQQAQANSLNWGNLKLTANGKQGAASTPVDQSRDSGIKNWWKVGDGHVHWGHDHWGSPHHVHHGGGGWEYGHTGMKHGHGHFRDEVYFSNIRCFSFFHHRYY